MFVVGETEKEPEVAVPDPKFFVQLVAFVEDQVSVDDWPEVMEVGDAESAAVGVGVADATTAVQAPQLSDSFDSVMVPDDAAEFLSAQTRTYHVAAEGNV